MEMDQIHLKDMGIKKVGDRVRIGSQAKQLRNKEFKKASKRVSNRVRNCHFLPSALTVG
jgi:mitogen-activated protein kinase kinase kinase